MKAKYIVGILILVAIFGFVVFSGGITGYLNKTVFYQTCKDSDYRLFLKSKSFYEKGDVVITVEIRPPLTAGTYSDLCIDENTLQEYYCGWNYREYILEAKSSIYKCPKGCKDGACVR
jgi:hypothetical protein